ncbi:MAG TPA: sigma 54-interacting transcriptional regulator [Polyangiales bacterium]|nr:sigma 54-interacting transcriptional regulator [Polyangiales bacterium]
MTSGPDVGTTRVLGPTPVVVGSSPANGLFLADRHVSRTHCELFLRDGECVVRDLGSRNGTFVDGNRVQEAVIGVDSRLRVGHTDLSLHVPETAPDDGATTTVVLGGMVGSSKAAQRMFAALRSIAGSSLSCLLLGETGTGKELAARALHEHSPRAGKPFFVVDCASVGAQFIEDKLFGHERGAFTGATSAMPGVFEEARGGSVFLDEIGELPLPLQAKLLGVLERREVTRIGSHAPIKIDFRLVAATHRHVVEMAQNGEFRQDLLYRLSEFTLRLPSLRERSEDIPLIAQALLQREGRGDRRLSEDAAEYLRQLFWPGNIRELRNVMRRAAALATGPIIDRDLLLNLEEVTADFQMPEGFSSNSPPARSLTPVARTSWPNVNDGGPVSYTPSGNPKPIVPTDAPAIDPAAAFDLPLAEASEVFRAAYMKELRRRFGDDLNGAAAHAGVHPKSVSRLFRLYRAY